MILKDAKPGDKVIADFHEYTVGEDNGRDMLRPCYDNDGYMVLFNVVKECKPA